MTMEFATERIERLLALLLVRDLKGQNEKILALNLAGFTSVEIADLLQTSAQVVRQSLYESRKAGKPRKRARKR